MEEEGGVGTDGPGPDPTALAASLGKQTVLSGFFTLRQGHQTMSQTRAALFSELHDGTQPTRQTVKSIRSELSERVKEV